jgi:hypothetical protein
VNRLGFAWARLRGDEAALAAMGLRPEAVLAELDGLDVALVGNARSLAGAGPAIDGAGVVARLNAAPLPSAASHGTRTDWLALSVPVDARTLAARAPRRLLWMTPRRRRLPWRIASDPRFVLWPPAPRLAAALGARPSTGLMAIDLLARSRAARVTLYGFDFFASRSLSGRRAARDVPHDFAAERGWVEALLGRDGRFSLWR